MSICQCPKGHLYDDAKNSKCPFCDEGMSFDSQYNYNYGTITDRLVVYPDRMPVSSSQKDAEAPYIFISYAHSDSKEVLSVIDYLQKNHFNLWYDEGIQSGQEWSDVINKKIKKCKQFICFISQNSIDSRSVKDEVHIAWKYNINIIVVYLEKLQLDGGLEMKLDRRQAILKYALSEDEFRKKLSASISQDVVNLKDVTTPDDMRINDRYEVISLLSKGGTATTYLARNKMTGAKVVLKHGVYDNTVSGQRIIHSFEQERDILSRNISPFAPMVYDYFCDSGNVYIVENYIEGTPISAMTDLPIHEKVKLIIEAAKVMREFHNCGICHCDIKPEHIIVNKHGCFVIDFGSAEDLNSSATDYIRMGTVAYAAPEQFASYNGENDIFGSYQEDDNSENLSRNIDQRTDIYALGRVMVKIISDSNAINHSEVFGVTTPITTVLFSDTTKSVGQFHDNPLLLAIVEKMLREKKSNRYNNMDEVIRVLEDFVKIYGN